MKGCVIRVAGEQRHLRIPDPSILFSKGTVDPSRNITDDESKVGSMFQLLSPEHVKLIEAVARQAGRKAVRNAGRADPAAAVKDLSRIIGRIHTDIPPKKRISIGRYSIALEIGIALHPLLSEAGVDPHEFGVSLFRAAGADPFVRSLGVQLVSLCGLESGKLGTALPIFEEAADDADWLVRECAVGFIRKLFRKYPGEVGNWYRRMAAAAEPNKRRFACESLRPVAENAWFRSRPELVLPIIEPLFAESAPYPRTSAGNSLSDWMRIDSERTWAIVERLAKSGNRNSWWIAYRACRNIVKREPERVMRLLGVDTYKYKDRVFSSDGTAAVGRHPSGARAADQRGEEP